MVTANIQKIENELLENLQYNNIIDQIITNDTTIIDSTQIYHHCYILSNIKYNNISDFLLQVFVSSFYYHYSIDTNIWLKNYNYDKFMDEYHYLIERIMIHPSRDNMQAHEIYAFLHQLTSDIFKGRNIQDISNFHEVLIIYHKLGKSLYYTWCNKLSNNLKDVNLVDKYFFMAIHGLI